MKKYTKIIYIIVGSLMTALLVTSLVGYFVSSDIEVKSNCLFASGQSALFLAVNFVPLIFKKLKLYVPDVVYLIFMAFCLAHFLLGEILGFFATIKWWDSALHTISGALITILAFSFISLLNRSNKEGYKISVTCAVVSALCISITVGVVWEIVEFLMDSWFGLNMQRAYVSNASGARGEALIGSNALLDTMKDLMLDAVGSLIVCLVIAIVCKKKNKGVDQLVLIKKIEDDTKKIKIANKIKIDEK